MAVAPQKLRNFIEKGPQLDLVTDDTLAAKGDEMVAPTITAVMEGASVRHNVEPDDLEAKWEGHGPPPDVHAKENIPVTWSVSQSFDIHANPRPLTVSLMCGSSLRRMSRRRKSPRKAAIAGASRLLNRRAMMTTTMLLRCEMASNLRISSLLGSTTGKK